MTTAARTADVLERPHLVWWVLVLGGLTVLVIQSFSAPFYDWWVLHVNPLPLQHVMRWILYACFPVHVYEALYVHAKAGKVGMPRSRTAWTWQTFLLGYPSTHLFRKHARLAQFVQP